MFEFLTDPSFMPHGYCLRWQPGLLWTHVISDIAIALAYFSIPGMIIFYLRKRTAISEIPGIYLAIGLMFSAFIVFCGVTHVLGMVTIWLPWYGLQGISKAATAIISVATALAMIPILPRALTLRTAEELESINLNLIHEISQRKEREEQLAQKNQELQQEIIARNFAEEDKRQIQEEKSQVENTLHELRVAQARLVESEKLASLGKSMAGIAHEVNTPIGIAITSISSMSDDLKSLDSNMQSRSLTEASLTEFVSNAKETAALAESSLHRAAGLLQSVKQVATDQSNDDVRSIDLKDYLQLVLDSIKPKFFASRREVIFDCPNDLIISCPPGAISQIVTNLVLNALVHAYNDDDTGDIRLTVDYKDQVLLIDCADDGKGIPMPLQEKIFQPFFTTKAGEGGTGIGLDIVRSLVVDKLSGQIDVVSEEGKGATFRVRIPL